MGDQFVSYLIDGISCISLISEGAAQYVVVFGFDDYEPVDAHPEDLPFGWGLFCPTALKDAERHVAGSWREAAMTQHREDQEYERGAHVDRCVEDDRLNRFLEG